ncbi:hypothetical protein A0H81_10569 [Grifola frondosa]|uniref:Uncharacterized protein n=1 Tax=Grifola frondosa TaxID=5627 RepID=A0A1C7LYI0_GRIFR|nr:hypothetical protein A0H81_10569 [Grifola frondosa]
MSLSISSLLSRSESSEWTCIYRPPAHKNVRDDARQPRTLQYAHLQLPATQHTCAAAHCACVHRPRGAHTPSRSTSFSNLHTNPFAFCGVLQVGSASCQSMSGLHNPRMSSPEFDDEYDFGRDLDDDSGEYSPGNSTRRQAREAWAMEWR